MIQSLLTKETPEIIRFFRSIDSLSEMLDKQEEKLRPVLNGERYITDCELAEQLKLTRRTLAEYRINGKLPYYKIGGKLLYKYLQPIITQYFIDNKSEIWLLFLIAHSKR